MEGSPGRFPSSSTCYRRFSKGVKDGRLKKILEALARHLEDKGRIDLEECFIDGTFAGQGIELVAPHRKNHKKLPRKMVECFADIKPFCEA